MLRLQRLLRYQTRGLEICKPYSQSGTVTMDPGLVETDVKSDAVGEVTAGQKVAQGIQVVVPVGRGADTLRPFSFGGNA